MRPTRSVLLVDARPDLADVVRELLLRDARTRVVVASDAAQARELAERDRPIVMIVDLPADPARAGEIAGAIASIPGEAGRVAFVPAGAAEAREACYEAGLEDVIERPVEVAPLRVRLRAASRLADRDEALALMSADHALLRERLDHQGDQVPALLHALLDLGFPGAIDQRLRTVDLALKVAARFGVPDALVRDLEQAARLHELGRLVTPEYRVSGRPGNDAWRYTRATVGILQRVDGFEGASELIASIYENWDGTGHPEHWRAGQIPLRSRILRVVVDFFAALEQGVAADAALETLEEHAGTIYDPMAVVHLQALLDGPTGEPPGSSVLVPIVDLEVGMVLAEDLYADSGLKLLARGTQLTASSLQILLRRHRGEPILHGAAVRRASAA